MATLVGAYSYEQSICLQFGEMLFNRLGCDSNQLSKAVGGMMTVLLDSSDDFLPNYLSNWIVDRNS